MIDRGEAAFQACPVLRSHLAWESFLALARKPGRLAIIDATAERRTMRSGWLLTLGWLLSKELRRRTTRSRVGIVFPPGIGAALANLAVVLAGKVPVNLNFTLGTASLEACLKTAELDCILTAQRVQAKCPGFPWPESGVVDLVETLKSLPKASALGLWLTIRLLPAGLVARLLRVPHEGDRREAALLFTSGSSGEPKGVVLSHRNILGNCAQVDAAGLLPGSEILLSNLPVFHSFGFTIGLWLPILRGCRLVTVPSPLEVKKTADVAEAEDVTVLVGTPTFLRPYLKRIDAAKLGSVRYVIAGAEKAPEGFADAWEAAFGSSILEGYGLTETAPVVSVNAPGHVKDGGGQGFRSGSVGRLLPGMAARILDPDTRAELDTTETGLLLLKGPNVFEGYLNQPEQTAAVKEGDWFITGDLARFDEDGFLYIEGRLSRFSKIGGEMVPHGTVELALIEAFGLQEAELPPFAVTSRPDEAKGEQLVLLTSIDLDPTDVRSRLEAAGLPNLWMPKVILRVDAIPILATGKLDLRAIRASAAGA